jgi:hypothetical protein
MPIVLNFVKGCISLYTLYSTIEEKDSRLMAKAMTTIKQVLSYQPNHAQWFAENQALYNRVVAFYFEVINAHEKILDLPKKDALTALEKLTHRTEKNPDPIIPLHEIAKDIAAMEHEPRMCSMSWIGRTLQRQSGTRRIYHGCAIGLLPKLYDARKCRQKRQSCHWSASGCSLPETQTGKAFNSFACKEGRESGR